MVPSQSCNLIGQHGSPSCSGCCKILDVQSYIKFNRSSTTWLLDKAWKPQANFLTFRGELSILYIFVLQIQKILSMYTPANEYEERVPVSVIRLVNQRSGADRANPAHLMADVNHILPIDFLYTPSDVSFHTLTIPKAINLDFVVKI